MNKRIQTAVALTAAGVLALSACGGSSASGDSGETINYTAFSIMEAANEIVFEDFKETDEGDGVEFEGSYGRGLEQGAKVWPHAVNGAVSVPTMAAV